ncbi:MAG: PadR family transcriptional regulator [Eggerthellaceae bacterium]
MDAQMKRGFLEACVLATLCKGESYGYQIIKDIPESLDLTESTLYPLLKRLEAAQCISVRSAEHRGRLRKYYRITQAGIDRIEEFISEREVVEGLYSYVMQAADPSQKCAEAIMNTVGSELDDGRVRSGGKGSDCHDQKRVNAVHGNVAFDGGLA